MKVLDSQWGKPKMPKKIKDYFFKWSDCLCNDVYIEYTVGVSSEDEKELTPLDKWLIEKVKLKEWETILIKHWH